MTIPSLPGSRIILVLLTAMACTLFALPAVAGSQARIVRLSDVQGSVEIDKNTGLGFESAFLNLPVMQGAQLRTRGTGRAEIEFEDGSTMRVGPNTTLEFGTLGVSDSGQRISEVTLTEGLAYVNWLDKGTFTLNFSRERVALDHPAHFRVEALPEIVKFAVFKGNADVEGPTGKIAVAQKKMAEFDVTNQDQFLLAKEIEEGPLDNWDRQAIQYHEQYARNNSSPYGYGASDLGYYGNYTTVPGYGMMWQPFFTGVGWNPFMDGAWSWYPGYGSMFVSAYPWGWLPYRYGNWMFVPGFGWMWQPGGYSTWNLLPNTAGKLPVTFHPPVAPAGVVHPVVLGKGGPVESPTPSFGMVIRNGSGGIGVARGSIANLKNLNRQAAKSGSVEVRSSAMIGRNTQGGGATGSSGGRSGMSSSSMSSSSMSHSASASSGGHASSGHR